MFCALPSPTLHLRATTPPRRRAAPPPASPTGPARMLARIGVGKRRDGKGASSQNTARDQWKMRSRCISSSRKLPAPYLYSVDQHYVERRLLAAFVAGHE